MFGIRLCVCLGLTVMMAGAAAAQNEVADAAPAPEVVCEQKPFSILVTVKNIKDDRGTITIDVHDDDPAKFLKSGGKLARLRFPAAAGEMKICVPVEKAGVYALLIYQDRNSDLKFGKTWVGLPAEPYGVTNDPPMRLGPPKHKDATFEVTGPLTPAMARLHN